MKCLLDNNVCIRAMKGDAQVNARLTYAVPDECGVLQIDKVPVCT